MTPPPEPNRLRDEAVPNRYRTGMAADRNQPANALGGWQGEARTGRRSIGSRGILKVGVAIAIAGLPLFFGSGLAAQEAGLGLISLGVGIALVIVSRRLVIDAVARARRSRLAAAGVLLGAPHLIGIGVVGLGLVAFGLMVLAVAAGLI